MMVRKNQKGFSLVELIVVVLIIGILGVALAPQVMKWVGVAKKSADFQAADDIKAIVQVAIADYESLATTTGIHNENYNVRSIGFEASDGTDDNPGLTEIMDFYAAGTYPPVQDTNGMVFQIQLLASGQKIIVKTVTGTY